MVDETPKPLTLKAPPKLSPSESEGMKARLRIDEHGEPLEQRHPADNYANDLFLTSNPDDFLIAKLSSAWRWYHDIKRELERRRYVVQDGKVTREPPL